MPRNVPSQSGTGQRSSTVRPHYSPWPELMSFQADPSSGLVYHVIKELRDAGRLKLESVQKAYIIGVEGTKGKQSFGRNSKTALAAFGRTATHVFRMVMLEACGVEPEHWPCGGESSYKNENKLQYEQVYGPKLVLAESYEEAREYWCEFDKMYPHYVLEKFLEERTGTLNNVMIIFKNYMQEVIEISMNVCAEHVSGKNVKCCISSTVVHRSIKLEGASGPWMNALALSVRGTRCPLARHFDMLLDLDKTGMSSEELDKYLSVLYDSLPTKITEIDDTDYCVKLKSEPAGNILLNSKGKVPQTLTSVDPHSIQLNPHSAKRGTQKKPETSTERQETTETVEVKTITTEKRTTKTKTQEGKTQESSQINKIESNYKKEIPLKESNSRGGILKHEEDAVQNKEAVETQKVILDPPSYNTYNEGEPLQDNEEEIEETVTTYNYSD